MKRAVLGLLVLAGCDDDDCCKMTHYDAGVDVVLPQDANTALTEVALLPAVANRELDLLFVIDDSRDMLDKQQRLAAEFQEFRNLLALPAPGSLVSGLPSLHVGVATTDMGMKSADDANPGASIGNCGGTGKDGVLQVGSAPVTGVFLRDENDGTGVRTTNYSGSIVDALTQMASVGNQACPLAQPLHAMQRALTNSLNDGFLRASARLAVVLLTDKDDCSASHASLFSSDTSTLGPLSTFRCTRFGVTCDGGGQDSDQMNIPGPKTGCHSSASTRYLTDTTRYAAFLSGLKRSPRDVMFAAIAGPSSPFNILLTQPGVGIGLDASCTYDTGTATETALPAARLAELADLLPNGSHTSICGDFYSEMHKMAYRVRDLLGMSRCLLAPIALPQTCEAVDIDAAGNETVIPACTATVGPPCFRIAQHLENCQTVQGLEVEIMRASPASAETWTSIRCAI